MSRERVNARNKLSSVQTMSAADAACCLTGRDDDDALILLCPHFY